MLGIDMRADRAKMRANIHAKPSATMPVNRGELEEIFSLRRQPS